MKVWLAIGFLWLAALASACSGPHVQEAMLKALEFGWIGFGIQAVGAIFANSWHRISHVGPAKPIVLIALLAIHPTWWISPYHGDCGGMLTDSTIGLFLVSGGVYLWQLENFLRFKMAAKQAPLS